MVFRVVSTKLTEEEHTRLLDVCNLIGCTPSNLIREALLKIVNQEHKTIQKEPNLLQTLRELNTKPMPQRKEYPSFELARILGVRIN
jgi:hypothetical protein